MRSVLLVVLLSLAAPAFANHPEELLDKIMVEREPAFEPTGLGRLPALDMQAADRALDLDALEGQIVVLSFVPGGCGEPCADQQALLKQVQEAIGVTPMREMVTFVSVAPGASPEGSDAANWITAQPREPQTTDTLATSFAALSDRDGSIPMAHVIDRSGRHAGIFHGADFEHVDMTLYVNGLTNAHPHEPGMVDRILGVFR